MTVDLINTKAIQLLDFLFESDESRIPSPARRNPMSSDHLPLIVDLTDYIIIDSPMIAWTRNQFTWRPQIAEVSFSDKCYWFDPKEESTLVNLIQAISDLPEFTNTFSSESLEKSFYLWAIETKKNGRVINYPIDYISENLKHEVKKLTVQFPITNLHIQSEFCIGNVLFTFHTEETIRKIWNSFSKKTQTYESFYDSMKKYQGRVFACYTVCASPEKATEVALRECEHAVNILKLTTPTIVRPNEPCLVDLDIKLSINYSSEYLLVDTESHENLQIQFSANAAIFHLDDDLKDLVHKNVLDFFSDFLKKIRRSDFDAQILQAVKLYSFCLSTNDLHMRASLLISIIESLLLEESHTSGPFTNKIKQRFCGLLQKQFVADIKLALDNLYEIRHKMIHKGKRLDKHKFIRSLSDGYCRFSQVDN